MMTMMLVAETMMKSDEGKFAEYMLGSLTKVISSKIMTTEIIN